MAVQNYRNLVGPAVSADWLNVIDYTKQIPLSSGISTALVVDFPGRTVPFVAEDGVVVKFLANVANGATPTIAVGGGPALNLLSTVQGALIGNEFQAGDLVWIQFHSNGGNHWKLVQKTSFANLQASNGNMLLDFSGTTLRLGGTGAGWTAVSIPDNTSITGTLDVSGLATFTGADVNGTAILLNTAVAATSFANLRVDNTRSGSGSNILLDCSNGTDANCQTRVSEVGAATKFARIGPSTNIPLQIQTNNLPRLQIDASGRFLVNTTVNFGGSAAMDVEGGAVTAIFAKTSASGSFIMPLWNTATSGNNCFIEFATEGSYTARGSITYNRGAGLTAYNTTSDQRLKNTLNRRAQGVDPLVDQLQVHQYSWKDTGIVGLGCYAQELATIAPEAVSAGDNDPDLVEKAWGVDYSKLVPRLILEIQSLRRRVAALESASGSTIREDKATSLGP